MTKAIETSDTLLTAIQETSIDTKQRRLAEIRQLLAELGTGAQAA